MPEMYDEDREYIDSIIDEDIPYHAWLETGQIATIADYDETDDWPYEINDPKHPHYHETFSDISDLADIPF